MEKIQTPSWIFDLYRLAQSTSQDEIGDIYQQILMHFVDGCDAKSGCLALHKEGSQELTIVAGIDLPADVIGTTIALGTGVLGWTVQENMPLLLHGSISNDPRFRHVAERKESSIPHSAICWPLKVEERVIGAVSVNRSAERPLFTQTDVDQGILVLNLISLVLSNIQLQIAQQRRIEQLKEANRRLEEAQNQLMQSEKMAAIGQMAAGVAHEINNPIGFVSSNLTSLEKYLHDVFSMLDAYERAEPSYGDNEDLLKQLQSLKQKIDLQFLREDIPSLIAESRDGITRVKNIVQNLKDFSRLDSSDEWQLADLHRGIESTITIAWNQLKYKAEIVKQFGDIPPIECLPSQLNQVFLNILVNAGHAIADKGVITIRTTRSGGAVIVAISDTGCGIRPDHLNQIFDPFFTTKKIGEGTGLGLSVSYGIVEKHFGKIRVDSEVGKGTTFTITLPIRHAPNQVGGMPATTESNLS